MASEDAIKRLFYGPQTKLKMKHAGVEWRVYVFVLYIFFIFYVIVYFSYPETAWRTTEQLFMNSLEFFKTSSIIPNGS